jgi:hypothetical protein
MPCRSAPVVLSLKCADLPHLSHMVKAFFRGAHEKLINFTQEYRDNGNIASLSFEERAAAFVEPTNDSNEGALGILRQLVRRMPNLSLQGLNARMLIFQNDAVEYYAQCSAEEKKILRAQGRLALEGAENKRRRVAHAEFRKQRAQEHAEKEAEKQRKKAEEARKLEERLRGVHVVTDEGKINAMKGPELRLQFEWHRRYRGVNEKGHHTVKLMSGKKVDEKREYLLDLVKKYKAEHDSHNGDCNETSVEMVVEAEPTSEALEEPMVTKA